MIRPASGVRRRMRPRDIDDVLRRAHRSADGSYRAVAGKGIPGRILGGFRYHGTRPDDPNDIVPHEHRRELRGLKVFGAWTNLVDMKAGNTLDTLIDVDGRAVVRHICRMSAPRSARARSASANTMRAGNTSTKADRC
jgi:hypothetical protein